jgi:phospholipid/cholesterol/gamma-HCH transport system substrate-binding protein
MIGLRHTDEWIGLLVIVAVALFLGSVLEAGVLHDWFRPVSHLRIVLPQSGVGGLAVGAEIEVLGTHAGTVRRIVLNPNQQMYAEADIDRQAVPFIRRDSQAIIRRRFGVAGAAYVDISRGMGTALDWNFAVIEATTERAPTDTVSAMIDELRQKLSPVADDVRRTTSAVAAITENLQKGQGTVGRLLSDDTLARQAEQTVTTARDQVAALKPAIDHLDEAARLVEDLAQRADSDKEGVPDLLRRADALMQSLQSASRDLARATPHMPEIADSVASSSKELPALLTQIQITTAELEHLLTQLRSSWLLGGGPGGAPPQTRLPPGRLQP